MLQKRVKPGQLFLWPIMAMLWGFDVDTVARRSLIAKWIHECRSVADCYAALYKRARSPLGQIFTGTGESPPPRRDAGLAGRRNDPRA